jgi:hypothetical protein
LQRKVILSFAVLVINLRGVHKFGKADNG